MKSLAGHISLILVILVGMLATQEVLAIEPEINWQFSGYEVRFGAADKPEERAVFTVNDPLKAGNNIVDIIDIPILSKDSNDKVLDSITLTLTESGDSGIFKNEHVVFMTENTLFHSDSQIIVETSSYSSAYCIKPGSCDPNKVDIAPMRIVSETDQEGLILELKETGVSTNFFRGSLTFSSVTTSSSLNSIKVSPGDIFTIKNLLTSDLLNGLILPNHPDKGAIIIDTGGKLEVSYSSKTDTTKLFRSCVPGKTLPDKVGYGCGQGRLNGGPVRAGLVIDSSDGGSDLSRPTFGLSHNTGLKLVEDGFAINGKSFDITDNWHTHFSKQKITIGQENIFATKVYSPCGLKSMEFMFGIPEIGFAHRAESVIEISLLQNGEIQNISVIQEENLINEDSISVSSNMKQCTKNDQKQNCYHILLSSSFNESPLSNVFALKAIDNTRRVQITYLNEGFEIEGNSLNPPKKVSFASPEKGVGLIELTQFDRENNYWIDDDGQKYRQNSFGSFIKMTSENVYRDDMPNNVMTRHNSNFEKLVQYEIKRANKIFDSKIIQKEISDSFSYVYPILESRINKEMLNEMKTQEEIANTILEKSVNLNRHS